MIIAQPFEPKDQLPDERITTGPVWIRHTTPGLGRLLVDTITGSRIQHLKELRPGTVRILFAFDPWRSTVLLVAGDKAGQWNAWYRQAIPLAEQRYDTYLKERRADEEGRQ